MPRLTTEQRNTINQEAALKEAEYQRKLIEGDPDTLKKEIEKLKNNLEFRNEMYEILKQEKDTLFYRLRDIYQDVMDEKSINKIFEDKKNQRILINSIKNEIHNQNRAYSCMLWEQWNEDEEFEEDPVAYWRDILEASKNGAKEKWIDINSDSE